MFKTFKYPVVHFPFNKTISTYYHKQDVSQLSCDDLSNINIHELEIELVPIIEKFVKYIVPIIGGGEYNVNQSELRIIPKDCQAILSSALSKNSIGIIVPITSLFGSNSLNIEEPPYSKCYRTLIADPGSFIVFDGNITNNNGIMNTTGLSSILLYIELLPRQS